MAIEDPRYVAARVVHVTPDLGRLRADPHLSRIHRRPTKKPRASARIITGCRSR